MYSRAATEFWNGIAGTAILPDHIFMTANQLERVISAEAVSGRGNRRA